MFKEIGMFIISLTFNKYILKTELPKNFVLASIGILKWEKVILHSNHLTNNLPVGCTCSDGIYNSSSQTGVSKMCTTAQVPTGK